MCIHGYTVFKYPYVKISNFTQDPKVSIVMLFYMLLEFKYSTKVSHKYATLFLFKAYNGDHKFNIVCISETYPDSNTI